MKNFLQTITSGLVLSFFFATLSFAQFESVKSGNGESINLNDPKVETWIHWDDGENYNAIGVGEANTWYGAIRFEPTDIFGYNGMEVTKVRVYISYLPSSASVIVLQGADAVSLIELANQEFIPVADSWNEIELTAPVLIDASLELWIVIEIEDPGAGVFPLGCDVATDADGKSNLVSFDFVDWDFLTTYGLQGDWNIQALVAGESEPFEVIFNLNMNHVSDCFNPDLDVIYITGGMLDWSEPGDKPELQTMTRIDDSFVFTKTLQLAEGEYQYKYFLNEGWYGGEWEGDPNRSILVLDDVTMNDLGWLTCGEYKYSLNLLVRPAYAGSVTGGACFLANAIVQISATPAEGYVFLNWTGDNGSILSTEAQHQFYMPRKNLTLTANFDGGNYVSETDELLVTIFPNPAQEYFIIRSAGVINDISIIDISGRIIYNQSPNSFESRIDNHLDAGSYILRITTAEGVFARKLLVR
jgi:uncharacterized repeat protein (TIGR02543 family)